MGLKVCNSAFLKIYDVGEKKLSPFGWPVSKKGFYQQNFLVGKYHIVVCNYKMRLHISHGTNNSVEGRSHQGNIIIVFIVVVVRQFALNKGQWILCDSRL